METAATKGIGSSLAANNINIIKPHHVPKITHCCRPSVVNYRSLQLQMMSSSSSHGLSPKKRQRFGHVGCVGELERELEAEMKLEEEEEEEWMRERCEGRKGMVELLECLETEAIMGEDEGKDPTDYNRRAQIFDKSSRVFQALKARTQPSQPQQS